MGIFKDFERRKIFANKSKCMSQTLGNDSVFSLSGYPPVCHQSTGSNTAALHKRCSAFGYDGLCACLNFNILCPLAITLEKIYLTFILTPRFSTFSHLKPFVYRSLKLQFTDFLQFKPQGHSNITLISETVHIVLHHSANILALYGLDK